MGHIVKPRVQFHNVNRPRTSEYLSRARTLEQPNCLASLHKSVDFCKVAQESFESASSKKMAAYSLFKRYIVQMA